MATIRRTFDAATVQPLVDYLRTHTPDRRLTLAEAEDAVLALFRLLGPDVLVALLQRENPPTAEKKGRHRFVRVAG